MREEKKSKKKRATKTAKQRKMKENRELNGERASLVCPSTVLHGPGGGGITEKKCL